MFTPPLNYDFNYDFIDKLEYDDETKKLILIIKNRQTKSKITRYVQHNYNKTPIYGDTSVKTKIIKNINKKININRFLEEELLEYSFNHEINVSIINYFDYIPTWHQKEIDIIFVKKEIKYMSFIFKDNDNKVNDLKKDILRVQRDYEKKVEINKNIQALVSIPESKKFYILCSFSILGLISWFFYISKKKAEENRIIKEDSTKSLRNNMLAMSITISKRNGTIKEIEKESTENLIKISLKKKELLEIELKNYKSSSWRETDEGFLDLRSSFNHNWITEIKGIYIIWNKTKNKYYVGQSKNIMKRVMNQHFNKGDVKNIIFAKDWFNDDDFYWKYIECQTKDEMDELEKSYIEEYNSFAKGYNSNSGNT